MRANARLDDAVPNASFSRMKLFASLSWVLALLALGLPYIDIEAAHAWGGNLISILQDQGKPLQSTARVLSYLGDEVAYVAALPVLILSVSYETGAQAFALFFTALVFNATIKTLLHDARPSWTTNVGFVCEIEYGNPSFHSQAAFMLYLFAAERMAGGGLSMFASAFIRCSAVVLAMGVAVSRCVLGAHFPHQVFAGSFFGTAFFATFEVLRSSRWLASLIRECSKNAHRGVITASIISLLGCGVGVISWGVTAAYFDFPVAWAQRAEASCANGERIDGFGGVRYTFLAVGFLATLPICHSMGILPAAMCAAQEEKDTLVSKIARGTAGVVLVAVLYMGIGKAVSKQWHIAFVLLFRYYVRGLIVGVATLLLLPLWLQRVGWLPKAAYAPLKDEQTSAPQVKSKT
eukprot:TRINITY_DN20259_c0_g5_i1.p1 TRINITY_DN20259_c0_g5~~TRINITY_DN20259_c0_g5_i1.p1  ORF type:complete len:417 (+),score=41.98 TRINITY_DN20259_c0_g5_i1:34-1251(+)